MRPGSPPSSTLRSPRFPAQFKRASPPEKHIALDRVRGNRTTLDDYRAFNAAVSEGWNVAPYITSRLSISNSGADT
jgi:hypothetical protein